MKSQESFQPEDIEKGNVRTKFGKIDPKTADDYRQKLLSMSMDRLIYRNYCCQVHTLDPRPVVRWWFKLKRFITSQPQYELRYIAPAKPDPLRGTVRFRRYNSLENEDS